MEDETRTGQTHAFRVTVSTVLDGPEVAGAPPPAALPIRDRRRYELLAEHARGGLGRVWKAFDRELGRVVALKEALPRDDASRARFVREALITARLEHPGIVPVHDAGRWDTGEPFYAMKLVGGRTLGEVVRERPALAQRLTLLPSLIAVADAIAYAHAQGVVHRDVKPSNVLVGEYGETVVIDWGIAKPLGDSGASFDAASSTDADATAPGGVLGTQSFMAPEQARGEVVDERADVYALGALLYYVLAGVPPRSAASTEEVLARARAEVPRSLIDLDPTVPAELAAVVAKAMAPDPALRYRSALALALDLKRFQNGQMVSAHQYSVAHLVRRWIERHRALALATALFVIVATSGAMAFVAREGRLRRGAEAERDRANRSTLALLEEQGRAELADGHPFRAAVYLAEAYRQNPSSTALRALVSEAIRPMARLERRLVGHSRDVVHVAYSRDGARIVTSSSDGTARIWSAADGRLLATLQGGDRFVDASAFSPDGALVAVATDAAVRIYHSEGGALARSIDDRSAYRVWFMPDGKRIIVGDQSGELRLRDAETGELVAAVKQHGDRISDLAFSPDEKRFAVASWDGAASVWDAASFRPLRSLPGRDAVRTGVAYSSDGGWLLTVDMEGELSVWPADGGERAFALRMPDGARDSLASFAPDGQTIVTRSHDGVVRIWHASSGALLESFDAQAPGNILGSAVRPDGAQLVTAGVGGAVLVWRLDDGPAWRILAHPPGARDDFGASGYSGDGRRVVTGSEDGSVVEWAAATGARLGAFAVPYAFKVAPDRDGSRVVAGAGEGAHAPPAMWDVASGQRLAVLEGSQRRVDDAAISADGRTVATASRDGSVRLYDSASGALAAILPLDPSGVTAVAFRPDGRELAAAGANGRMYLLEPAGGRIERVVAAHATWIQHLEYSRDGTRIVTAGRQDHVAKIWDAATGGLLLTLIGHRDNLTSASFSADGSWVATAATDNTAIVWDAATGEVLRTLSGPCYTAAFSPREPVLLTTGHHGYAVLWDLRLDERSPDAVARFVAERSPWTLVGGRARPRD